MPYPLTLIRLARSIVRRASHHQGEEKTMATKDAAASAQDLAVKAEEEPWTDAELAEVREELEAEVARVRAELESLASDLEGLLRPMDVVVNAHSPATHSTKNSITEGTGLRMPQVASVLRSGGGGAAVVMAAPVRWSAAPRAPGRRRRCRGRRRGAGRLGRNPAR